MKHNKEKFRLFGIINPVDVLAVLAVVALIWGASVFSAPAKVSAKPGDRTVRYTVELREKEEGFYQKVTPGATLYDTLKEYNIGTIVEAYALPYLKDVGDEENNIIRRAPVPGMEFTYVVVEAAAQVSDRSTSIGQYEILVNKEVFVKSKDFAGSGYITAIEYR